MQFSLSISNNLREVTDVSERVYAFCEKQGVDARRMYLPSRCVEEMAGNVVKYAFVDDKTHFIDIRVLQKGDQLILRLRDDGIPFNPLSVPLGKEANIGKKNSPGLKKIHIEKTAIMMLRLASSFKSEEKKRGFFFTYKDGNGNRRHILYKEDYPSLSKLDHQVTEILKNFETGEQYNLSLFEDSSTVLALLKEAGVYC